MLPVNAEEFYLHSPVHFHVKMLKHRADITQNLPGDGI
jgi:hypothetical protein